MTPDIVVDIGNTRLKWGLCRPTGVTTVARLESQPEAWDERRTAWRDQVEAGARRPWKWAIASVVPNVRRAFAEWVERHGDAALVLDHFEQLPIRVDVEAPERVGLDRLLTAVAANRRHPDRPAVLIDAGTTVTVDWLEAETFRGGTIFPGFALMAKALNDFTAQLPLVTMPERFIAPPGKATTAAMQAGIVWSIAGGMLAVTRDYVRRSGSSPAVFLTGGDAPAFGRLLVEWAHDDPSIPSPIIWPEQTLEGIRWAAEAQP